MNYAWVIDQRKCIGCHACTTACKSENEVPLSVDRTWVKYVEKGTFPNAQRHFGVLRCNHCAKPPCVDICPVTAMFQRPDGIVEFDSEVCIGCKGCIAACPYDAIYIDPDNGTAAKCNFCAHRLDVGLEPACVVVCPEEALIFGDLEDPTSKIAQMVGREKTQVRKPEKNTDPKCFYIGADEAVLNPDVQSHDESGMYMWSHQRADEHGVHMDNNTTSIASGASGISLASALNTVTGAKVAYDVSHNAPWGKEVSMYLWTKSISAGAIIIGWLAWFLRDQEMIPSLKTTSSIFLNLGPIGLPLEGTQVLDWLSPLTALIFLGLTGILLVMDLDRPERFWTILARPQWKSWLAIGAYIILFYSVLLVVDLGVYLFELSTGGSGLYGLCLSATLPLAILTAIYTAFLFAQAKGRDLWQSHLLPFNLFIQAITAGAAFSVIAMWTPMLKATGLVTTSGIILLGALLTHITLVISGEMMIVHTSKAQERAAKQMFFGAYKNPFWWGYVVLGTLTPVVMLLMAGSNEMLWLYPIAGGLALVGLFAYEHCFVMAGQSVRLS